MQTHGFIRVACCYALFALLEAAAHAATPQAQFPFTEAQIKALGIQLGAVAKSAGSAGQAYPATVELPPNSEQIVSAPAGGLVTLVAVRENDRVAPGQVLARLVSPELGPIQLQLVQAATRVRLARQTAARERELHKEGIIPLRRVQEADAQLAEAQAALGQSQAALELAGMARGDIARVIKTGRFDNQLALRASAAGTVLGVDVKPGQRVAAADPLLRVVNNATLWLEIHAPATTAGAWVKGASVRIDGLAARAQILSTGSAVDPASQTISVRARVTEGTAALRPGQAVKVFAPAPDFADAWDVPIAALARDGAHVVVFVRTARGFEARPVLVLASAGQYARVRGRLTAGERIATAGVVALKAAWLGEGGE